MLLYVLICLLGYTVAEKVIIIGAGAAGIATASKLLDHNITDFIILEAENRIGGRIHSIPLGNAYIDLGAQFVHGQKGNIAYDLAKDYVKHNPTIDNVAVYFDGTKRTGETLVTKSRELYIEIEYLHNSNLSLGTVYMSRYNQTILSKYKDDAQMTRYARAFLKPTEAAVLSLEGAFDWSKVSAHSNFRIAEGDQTLSWHGLGYKTILDILLKNYPKKTGYNIDEKVKLQRSVSKISLRDASVEVNCKDGSTYIGDHVVFTPSLGVLKNYHKKIFSPALNGDKVEIIEDLGFDGIMKIIVEFPQPWWQNEGNFLFVWSDEDMRDLKRDIPYGPRTDTDHWLTWFNYIGVYPNPNPNVMTGWYSGPHVEEVEKLSAEQMLQAIIYTLRKHLGRDYNITEPKTVIHTKWYMNPNFHGTYSYETVQLRNKNITNPHKILSKPLEGPDGIPRVLFAGEATNLDRFSTVDGAIGSGFREGDRLVNLLK